jgi:hypothetical protein
MSVRWYPRRMMREDLGGDVHPPSSPFVVRLAVWRASSSWPWLSEQPTGHEEPLPWRGTQYRPVSWQLGEPDRWSSRLAQRSSWTSKLNWMTKKILK